MRVLPYIGSGDPERKWGCMRSYGLVVAAVLAAGCGSKKAPGDLKVTGTPTGETDGKIHVTLAFSRPMVAKDQLDKAVASPPLKVEPELPGEAKWVDDKTLAMWPKADLPISTKFVVTVPRGTAAIDGNELPEDVTFEFATPRMTASLDVLGNKARAKRDQPIRIGFNQPVPLDQVTAHCKFAAGDKQVAVKNGPESPSGPAKGYTLAPAGELALDTAWKVSCDELKGSVGNLGAKPVELAFKTYGPLKFVKIDPSGNDIVPDESVRLEIGFTNPLKPPYQMKLQPAVAGFPQQCYALDNASPG